MPSYNEQLSKAALADTAFDMFPTLGKGELVLHVPHASVNIPMLRGYLGGKEAVQDEINLLTDWHTDTIFRLDDVATVACGFSRIFCDVERLPDEQEPMFAAGRGFFYTRKDNGDPLRKVDPDFARQVWELFYLPYHRALEAAVRSVAETHGRCVIVDCHSFPDKPLVTDSLQDTPRPDICLGIDEFHTPVWLRHKFEQAFLGAGFSVGLNTPYAGTMVPQALYRSDYRIISIMVEVNRKLYLGAGNSLCSIAAGKIQQVLQNIITE